MGGGGGWGLLEGNVIVRVHGIKVNSLMFTLLACHCSCLDS